MGIDFLAFSAWSSASRYARIGYEVKVSRSDLRNELLRPGKRAQAVGWCHEFYFALPVGLLSSEELSYQEPEWEPQDFVGAPCPGVAGKPCRPRWRQKTHYAMVPVPATYPMSRWSYAGWTEIVCPTCNGKGVLERSRVEQEAPRCWIPRDVGLVLIDGNGTRMERRSPRRADVPTLTDAVIGQLVRWVSVRPDMRHAALRKAVNV